MLTDILRKNWGYEGMVDRLGRSKDRAKGIAAGQDLEMPGGSGRGTNSILSAIKGRNALGGGVERCRPQPAAVRGFCEPKLKTRAPYLTGTQTTGWQFLLQRTLRFC